MPSLTATLPFTRILLACDHSPASRRATQIAASLAQHAHGELFLVHSSTPLLFCTGQQAVPYEIVQRTHHDIHAELQRDIGPNLRLKPGNCSFGHGEPVGMICCAAREHSAHLIVIPIQGSSGLQRLALGCVGERVLHRTSCPVLLVGPLCRPTPAPFANILFATDLRQTGLRPAHYAAALAGRSHGKLTCLHVLRRASGLSASADEQRRTEAASQLAALLPQALVSTCCASAEVTTGDAAHCILTTARNTGATVIVLGVHDGLGLQDHSLWSTLAHVVRESPCPVLCIRDHPA